MLGAQALVPELLIGSVGVDDEVLHKGADDLYMVPSIKEEVDMRVCQQSCRLSALAFKDAVKAG